MSIDDQELRALAFLALRVRRATPGAGAWDELGLMTNLRKIQDRNLHMTVEHVLRHAADPAAKSPGVIQGRFTPEAPKVTGQPYPPKRDQECRVHPGQWSNNCAGCRVETVTAWHDPEGRTPKPPSAKPGDTAAGVGACRAGLAKVREVGA